MNDSEKYVPIEVIGSYYGVTTEIVRNWIKDGKISGKQLSGKWFIPADEFEYLRKKEDMDETEDAMRELLGENYTENWSAELDEDYCLSDKKMV